MLKALKKRKTSKKFKTICVVGLPKCGTSYLLDFFTAGNFINIEGHKKETNKLINNYKNIRFKHCFAKNPKIIWDVDAWQEKIKEFQECSGKCLFIVCVRPYNEAIYSLYNHWRKRRVISTKMQYERFLKSHKKTYIGIENNIIKLKNTVENLVVIPFHESIINKNTYEIAEDLNIDFKTSKEKVWSKHTPAEFPEETFVDEDLSSAYKTMLNNISINSITYKNKKYLYDINIWYMVYRVWKSLNS